jgi:signal transduction histidine kinase
MPSILKVCRVGRCDPSTVRMISSFSDAGYLNVMSFAVANPVTIDLIDVLDPVLRDAELEGQARSIGIHYAGPERLDLTCDPELLHRAFENILRNALRHSPAGSIVTVAVLARQTVVEVTVSDRGAGVEEARLATIFQPFVRDADGMGTGLGLEIAANALRLHGGTIRASNQSGGGLAVTCVLPLVTG